MIRAQITHVRKFGGVWYQLSAEKERKEPCTHRCPFNSGVCSEPWVFGLTCYATEELEGLEWFWKEIGKI